MQASPSNRLGESVRDLLREGGGDELAALLAACSPADLADLLEHLDSDDREVVFEALSPALAGEVAAILDDTVREDLVEDLPASQLAAMLSDLDSDEALSILEDTSPETTAAVLDRLDPEEAGELRELLGYEEETAGRAMAFGAPAVRLDQTLGEAMELLRRSGELEDLHVVFVVDGAARLKGFLPLRALLLGAPETPVEEVVDRRVPFAFTYEDQETAIGRIRHSPVPAVPVVDERGVLRGQITPQRISEIVEEERSEDMYRLAGLSEDESLHGGVADSLRTRTPMLLAGAVTMLLAALVISRFEAAIGRLAILAALQTTVAGMGSRAGTQTLTLVVSSLAMGELDWRNALRTLRKEVALALLNGLLVGTLTGAVVAAWIGRPALGLLVGVALLLNLLVGVLAAVLVPLGLRALRLDPAQASGVIVEAVAMLCGFALFLGLATACLPLLN